MARLGITYQQVIQAIDGIVANDEKPTIQRIRGVLGTGSPNTIHRHLIAWQDSAPIQERKAPELPSSLQAAIVKELERQSAESRSVVESKLVESQANAVALQVAGEILEAEMDETKEGVQFLSDEVQRLQGVSNERLVKIEQYESELKKEREAANSARIQVAKEQLKTETQAEKLIFIEELNSELKSELNQSQTGRVEAEKGSAVAETKNESLKNEVNNLSVQIKSIQTSNDANKSSMESELKAVRADFNNKTSKQESNLKATLDELKSTYEKNITKRENEFNDRLNELKASHDALIEELKVQIKPETKKKLPT